MKVETMGTHSPLEDGLDELLHLVLENITFRGATETLADIGQPTDIPTMALYKNIHAMCTVLLHDRASLAHSSVVH